MSRTPQFSKWETQEVLPLGIMLCLNGKPGMAGVGKCCAVLGIMLRRGGKVLCSAWYHATQGWESAVQCLVFSFAVLLLSSAVHKQLDAGTCFVLL